MPSIKEQILHYFRDINYVYNNSTKYDTLKSMLDALEQEPCEDCIRRQDAVNACWNGWGYNEETIKHIERNILNLPPVSPKTKRGHWEANFRYGMYPNEKFFICSECHEQSMEHSDYCPNCGANMQEEKK